MYEYRGGCVRECATTDDFRPSAGISPYRRCTGFVSCSLRSARYTQPFRFLHAKHSNALLSGTNEKTPCGTLNLWSRVISSSTLGNSREASRHESANRPPRMSHLLMRHGSGRPQSQKIPTQVGIFSLVPSAGIEPTITP